jgi:hypothetical protein
MPVKLMPLRPGLKTPFRDSYQRITDDPAEHLRWIKEGFNIAFMLAENGCSAGDFDRKDAARKFYADHYRNRIFNCLSETKRGAHFLWRGTTRTRKMYDATGNEIGDWKGNGYIVWPNSIVNGWQYRFVKGLEFKFVEELLPLPEELLQEVKKTVTLTREKVRNLDAYLAKIESVQGNHGFASLLKAAVVCRNSGLSESETTIKILWWNTLPVVSPPWSHKEIASAVTRVFKKGKA